MSTSEDSDNDSVFDALADIPPSAETVIQHLYDLCRDHSLKLKHSEEWCNFCIEQFIGDLKATASHNYTLSRYCELIRDWLETVKIVDGSRVTCNPATFASMMCYKQRQKIPDDYLIGPDRKLII